MEYIHLHAYLIIGKFLIILNNNLHIERVVLKEVGN